MRRWPRRHRTRPGSWPTVEAPDPFRAGSIVDLYRSPDRVRLKPTVIARAFELARAGACGDITRIADQLMREGYEGVPQHLSGTQIRKELRQMIRDARPDRG